MQIKVVILVKAYEKGSTKYRKNNVEELLDESYEQD
jgi:hypothetical protein